VTAQPHAHVRFRRAIERRALWLAEDAARELPNLSLQDALQLVHLYAERRSPKFEPAARRWLIRYLSEGTPSLRDVDRRAGVVTVRRTVVEGVVKPYGKTDRSLRAVPLPTRAAEALDEHPTRLDTRILFPGARGGPMALSPFRHREWNPALRAAGLELRSTYALRHTYARMSSAAGVSLFELSRIMGTSPAMLDRTYGHMLPDALDRARSARDAFVWARNGHSTEAAEE
jgi:hypothetical protein